MDGKLPSTFYDFVQVREFERCEGEGEEGESVL